MKCFSPKNIGLLYTFVSLFFSSLLPSITLANDCNERGFKILIQEKHLEHDESDDSFSHNRIWRDLNEGTWSTALPEHGKVAIEKRPQDKEDPDYSIVLSFLPDNEFDGLSLETTEAIKLSSTQEITRFGEEVPTTVHHSDSDVSEYYEKFLKKAPKGELFYRVFRGNQLLCSKKINIIGIIDN